jgi:alanyl aminopeptidase
MIRHTLLAFTVLAAACAGRGGIGQPGTRAADPDGLTAPRLRLPDGVAPRRQAVRLRLTPGETAFSGDTQIDVDVRRPAPVIWLHAAGLTVDRAELRAGATTVALRSMVKEEFLALVSDQPLPPGPARLDLSFHGTLLTRDDRGVYREQERGQWYIFTQFEATDARRAFPCFDEPSYKIPWTLTLDVPAGHRAFANSPQTAESPLEGGARRVSFAETRPLPSYLVAFAVGPFEIVDVPPAGGKRTPIRLIIPAGGGGESGYAVKTTGEILQRLEEYFAIPYPYEKLDHLAVPQKGGAMENPGLVTYASSLMLARPGERNIRFERGYLSVAAHELGHIWFGDLVTTGWWDDVWLNEAFASWISSKIVNAWHPEWSGEVGSVQGRNAVMEGDALSSARRIRQPIESSHDIANAFDGITYDKGEAVIAMFEAYLGPERFQAGVRRYLNRHADGTTAARDFLGEIGDVEAGQSLGRAFSTFLDQPGFPLVTARLECKAGQSARLHLAQQRYRPRGSSAAPQLWQIPLCARWPQGRACTLLTGASGALELPGTSGCPEWVLPNAGAVGYYRVKYDGEQLHHLLGGGGPQLTVAERVGVLGDVAALVVSGEVPYEQALELIPELAQDPSRYIVAAAGRLLGGVSDHLVPDELRPNYVRFIRRVFGARARKLGWEPQPSDDDDTRLLRVQLVPSFADRADDAGLVAAARASTLRWLSDRKSLSPELVAPVLQTAAQRGDQALWTALSEAARREKDRRDRTRLLAALGSFRDPALVTEGFQLALGDGFDPRESLTLILGPAGYRGTRQMAYDFVKAHYDDIVARLPQDWGGALTGAGGGFCDPDHRADVEQFFAARTRKISGGPRRLSHTLEGIDLCVAARASQQESVVAFLRRQ